MNFAARAAEDILRNLINGIRQGDPSAEHRLRELLRANGIDVNQELRPSQTLSASGSGLAASATATTTPRHDNYFGGVGYRLGTRGSSTNMTVNPMTDSIANVPGMQNCSNYNYINHSRTDESRNDRSREPGSTYSQGRLNGVFPPMSPMFGNSTFASTMNAIRVEQELSELFGPARRLVPTSKEINFTLLDGPDEDQAEIMSTYITLDKYWGTEDVKRVLNDVFSVYLNGINYSLKLAITWGSRNSNGIRHLYNIDDFVPVPPAQILFMCRHRTIYVVPEGRIMVNDLLSNVTSGPCQY